jgi:hypothetical protein
MDPALLAQLSQNFQGGLGSLLSGLFIDKSKPYTDAQNTYKNLFPQVQQYYNQAQQYQNPFYQGGKDAIPQYQNWLNQMQDPSAFINKAMGSYQQSPWAKYEQDQAMRAANNFGSANGLTGSTPLMQQAQQNAAGISSADMQNYMGNIMGVNQQYGAGLQNMMGGGQNAANMLAQILGQQGQNYMNYAGNMADLDYARSHGQQENTSNIFSGLLKLLF